jgi:hypothetical protein
MEGVMRIKGLLSRIFSSIFKAKDRTNQLTVAPEPVTTVEAAATKKPRVVSKKKELSDRIALAHVDLLVKRGAKTYNSLMRGLNESGCTSSTGRKWHVESVKALLKRNDVEFHTEGVRFAELSGRRAPAVNRKRRRVKGRKPAENRSIPAELSAEIERRVTAGQITLCPPFVDSEGFNHLTGEITQ